MAKNKSLINTLEGSGCVSYKSIMKPEDVKAEAGKRKNENYKFRIYLKNHADEDELDR